MKRYIKADIVDYNDESDLGKEDFARSTVRPDTLRALAQAELKRADHAKNYHILIAIADNPNTPEDVRSKLISCLDLCTRFEFAIYGYYIVEDVEDMARSVFTTAGYEVLDVWVALQDYYLGDFDDDDENGFKMGDALKIEVAPIFDDTVCEKFMNDIRSRLSGDFGCTVYGSEVWFGDTKSGYLYEAIC